MNKQVYLKVFQTQFISFYCFQFNFRRLSFYLFLKAKIFNNFNFFRQQNPFNFLIDIDVEITYRWNVNSSEITPVSDIKQLIFILCIYIICIVLKLCIINTFFCLPLIYRVS